MRQISIVALLLIMVGCGAARAPVALQAASTAVRLRHQIMVEYGGEVQVFEGYMIRQGEAFLVKAFAGPGVDLFTVARDGDRHREEAHIKALEEKLDLEAVGSDIARAYLAGCERPKDGDLADCDFHGEPLEERYDERGRVVSRRFPEAHGIGMAISYSQFDEFADMAGKIEITWGDGSNRMVIKLLEATPVEGSVEELLDLR